MPKAKVNGQEVEFEHGMTVLQVCEEAGAEVPRFCYHERLSIAGNCRMCLVQIEGGPPKPAASCAMPAGDGMVIHTDTPMVKKAREGVMEFLLINHPLDCPICDQGGECDLQDQSMTYGGGLSRYSEHKRAVKEKNFGPLIKTHMTRCIHCTRCVRFATEIAGVEELGATSRGENMEIGTYVENAITSELSGNMIDLCPVGALTSKPYAYRARPWELKKTETIDVLDAVGSNIRVDARGREVMRVLPRLNEEINEEWISDKSRFACDGLKTQRLDRPYVRKKGKLVPATWEEAIAEVAKHANKLKGKEIAAIAGDLVDVESMMSLKDLYGDLGSNHLDCRQDGASLDASERASYLFNTTIAKIEEADACLLVGTNPRLEASLVNARLRKRSLQGGFKIANVGEEADLTYKVDQLGNDAALLKEILDGKHAFSKVLKSAKKPIIIVGQAALARKDGDVVLGLARDIADKFKFISDKWNGFNVLHTAAARVGGLDIGFVPSKNGKNTAAIVKAAEAGDIKFLYLLGADEIDLSKKDKKCFVVYQGHHGDNGAHQADVILPGAAYTEKNGTYVNTEGRVQRAVQAVSPPGEAKEDWQIIRLIAEALGKPLPYTSLAVLRERVVEIAPFFSEIDSIVTSNWNGFGNSKGKLDKKPFEARISNYYLTDPICRASKTMAECSRQLDESKVA